MGQAKRRLLNMKRVHPRCCICAGGSPTETIEHAPPKIMFWGKLRPKGMEVPACKRCNSEKSRMDQLAAFCAFSQYVDPINGYSDEKMRDFEKVSQGCINNIPDMRDLFKLPPDNGEKYQAVIFDNQRLFIEKLNPWAAKQALAHWFHFTDGRVFPSEGLIAIRWLTNVELSQNAKVFTDLLRMLGRSSGLKQGQWDVDDQFFIRWNINNEEKIGAMLCRYHGTAFVAALVEDQELLQTGVELLGGIGSTFKTNAISGIYEV